MIQESAITVTPGVRGACELLGLDPLYIANEGILVAVAEAPAAEELADEMRRTTEGACTAIIGEVVEAPKGTVLLKTGVGGIRIVDMLSGDQLPRIC